MKKEVNFREEAIECVKDSVLPMHKRIYDNYNGDFDRIYTEVRGAKRNVEERG